jgi:hypothetical protein
MSAIGAAVGDPPSRREVTMARRRLAKLFASRRFSPEQERLFLQFHADAAYPRARFGIVAGFLAWTSFSLWDALMFRPPR